MKRLLCSVLCLMLLYVPFASAAIDATQTNELLAVAYQQGLMAYGVLMRADFDAERQQLDVTLTENRFTLAQMEAKDLRDVLATICARTYGEELQKLRDQWGKDLDILIHVADVNGDELYRVKNGIPLRGKGEVRSQAEQQAIIQFLEERLSGTYLPYTISYLPEEDCFEIDIVFQWVVEQDWKKLLLDELKYENFLSEYQMIFYSLNNTVQTLLEFYDIDTNVRITAITGDDAKMFSILNGTVEE